MSTSALHRNRTRLAHRVAVPLLLNGDHLSVPEFERRYEAMLEDGKAELIEGTAIMAPPIGDDHADAHGLLVQLLRHYAQGTPGLRLGVNLSVRLDGRNEFQPDVVLRIRSGKMAGTKLDSKNMVEGRPELVVEIALTSASYDLHEKKTVYQRNQIPEYLVWEVLDSRIHWFALEAGVYIRMKARADGITASRIFPGLWLNLPALLAGDESKAFRAVDRGLKSSEHKAFTKKLAASLRD